MGESYIHKKLWILIALGAAVLVMTMVMNARIQSELKQLIETSQARTVLIGAPPVPQDKPDAAPRYRKRGQKLLRQDRLSPGRDYVESIFYLDGREIARQKIVDEKVLESSGEIPEGRVDFINEFKGTEGVEYYVRGQKDGPSKTYFSGGQLNVEAYYRKGKLLWKREYYNDGGIRIEINYEDARKNADAKETGVGKVYYRDGTLKYEWHLTNSEKIGFKKSYNQDGGLRAAFYFDENGQLME